MKKDLVLTLCSGPVIYESLLTKEYATECVSSWRLYEVGYVHSEFRFKDIQNKTTKTVKYSNTNISG